jgi:FAD:protein FMN transferase
MNALTASRSVHALAECVRARPLLGTLVEIAASGEHVDAVQLAISDAFDEVERVHQLMSYQSADSDISRINRDGFEQAVTVASDTWFVLEAAGRFSAASEGLFDITVAPTLTKLGFLPRHAGFPRVSGQGNWQHVVLLPDRRVQLARRLRIDVSGIAKGYAVDRAVTALQRAGMHSGRVNAGGDLRIFGDSAQIIHVRHPAAPTQLLPIVELTRGAVATSAGYYAQRRYQGRLVTPLIHPHTRVAADVQRSVSIFAEDCMTADALTKVVHADPVRAVAMLAQFDARAVMLEPDAATGGCRVFDTSRLQPAIWRTRVIA